MDEIKTIVTETLEKRGVLGKFKAQLRKTIITVLEDTDPSRNIYLENPKVQEIQSTDSGKLLAELIREYHAFYDLEYTNSVFVPEANLPSTEPTRAQLLERLPFPCTSNGPLLLQLLTHFQASLSGSEGPPLKDSNREPSFSRPTLDPSQLTSPFTSDPSPPIRTLEAVAEEEDYPEDFSDPGDMPSGIQNPSPNALASLTTADTQDDLPFSDKTATQSDIAQLATKYAFVEEAHPSDEEPAPAPEDSDSDHF
eukprot:NODE_4133_length_836_cov_54.365303_g3975_i0.p1 GENE.NODE_4133_length_836_cov_54.365303_g3975_i0~~NODE_4133_length_836_cov_54.365303_g3975_i0.p1  ORF type:complete len:253 (+),score=60.71 NODE_4133_length_836_cov_54.365303_g3975_i0:63-821(+)